MSVRASNWAWEAGRHHGLGQGELLVLLKCGDHSDQDGICWPGEKGLADYAAQHERTVRRNLGKLEKRGLLHRERGMRGKGRGRRRDTIVLHLDQAGETPGYSEGDQPDTENRLTGHPVHDQPDTGDTALYREPSKEPSGEPDTPAISRWEPVLVRLRDVAQRKGSKLNEESAAKACEHYAADHRAEVEKFALWHLEGRGQRRRPKQLAQAWWNWLSGADEVKPALTAIEGGKSDQPDPYDKGIVVSGVQP